MIEDWDLSTGRRTSSRAVGVGQEQVSGLSQDQALVIADDQADHVTLRSSTTGEVVESFKVQAPVDFLRGDMAQTGMLAILNMSDNTVRLWDTASPPGGLRTRCR